MISMVGTAQYNLAKYLNTIIKPNIPSRFMLLSTSDFVERLSQLQSPPNPCFVSFDVVSLFTNMPLEEVLNFACDYVYSDISSTVPGFDRKNFLKLLRFATSGEFLYKDKIFKQVDGVAMGSPLVLTLANLFMAHYEQQWLSSPSAPIHYFRYVDDIFCIFDKDRQNHMDFLSFLNTQHPNLQFTADVGPDSLPFLDVYVGVNASTVVLSVLRKETYTGLFYESTSGK